MHASNNIGFLRLMLASAVIFGHAPEMAAGDQSTEVLSRFSSHHLTIAGLALDFFFLLSGFLITKSFLDRPALATFANRRAARIVPGFVVAYLLCVFGLAPLTGGDPWHRPLNTLYRLVLLDSPDVYPGQLQGVLAGPYAVLNGAIWTIFYEVRCYVLTAILGKTGLLRRRRVVLALTCVALAASLAVRNEAVGWRLHVWEMHPLVQVTTGRLPSIVRFAAIYLVGTCFRLYWAEIVRWLDRGTALACLVAALLVTYFVPTLAEPAFTTLGAAWLFWMAIWAGIGPLQRVNNRCDISYGTYLYGWPAAMLFLWLQPTMPPYVLAPLALGLALTMGALSWWGIEKPVLDFARPVRASARAGMIGAVGQAAAPRS